MAKIRASLADLEARIPLQAALPRSDAVPPKALSDMSVGADGSWGTHIDRLLERNIGLALRILLSTCLFVIAI